MIKMAKHLSPNSTAVIQYRLDNPHFPLETIGHHFGLSRARVHEILKNAGVQTAGLKYEGMDCHIRNVPREVVESVKAKAKSEGLTFRLKAIMLWQEYGEGK
jgi:hypothetical protein